MSADRAGSWATRIPNGFWAVLGLIVWGLAVTALLDRTPYGLDEATARAVLFLWSISDQVASPIVTLGVPDFRAVYLIPAGVLFSGSLLAAKLCTLLIVIATAIGLYRWRLGRGDSETPLLASGLLLLSPLTITAIDHIAIGTFLLLTFLLGAWADDSYRLSRIRFGGFYFSQLLLAIAAVSLHPAGLAYPLVLAYSWLRDRPAEPRAAAIIPGRERTHVLVGVGIATLIGLALAGGWPHQGWFDNPVTVLAQDIFEFHSESTFGDVLTWVLGVVLLLAVLGALWGARAQILADRFAATLVLAVAIAALTADASYTLLVLVLLLYWGFPLLLHVRVGKAAGFAGQRGVAFALLIVLSTSFLSADRARYQRLQQGPELSVQDRLIQALAATVQQSHPVAAQPGMVTEDEKSKSGPRVASQWPGRTMIACRCSTLPLPPSSEDQAKFLANLRGLDYLVFDPQNPVNRELSRDFALLGGASAETVTLQTGGVVLRLHPAGPPAPAPGLRG